MKEIKLTQGKVAIVDDEDFEFLNQFKWCAFKNSNGEFVASRTVNKRNRYMHRDVLGLYNPSIYGDHIDHNGLNNQKHNLRPSSHHQNILNTTSRINSTSKYLGVSFQNKIVSGKSYPKWGVQIQFNKKKYHIGYFKNEHAAALAYNEKAKEFFGEFANLNFVEADSELAVLLGQAAPVAVLRHQLQFRPHL